MRGWGEEVIYMYEHARARVREVNREYGCVYRVVGSVTSARYVVVVVSLGWGGGCSCWMAL